MAVSDWIDHVAKERVLSLVKRKRETLKQKEKEKKRKKKNQLGLDHFLAVRLEIVSSCSQFARPNEQRTFPQAHLRMPLSLHQKLRRCRRE
jgi:hypothetical protein